MTIVEFLTARLDEEESGIREALLTEDYGVSERDLNDIAAKRRIMELHDREHECSQYDDHGDIENCSYSHDFEACSTLKLLALPYADWPGYDESWRP